MATAIILKQPSAQKSDLDGVVTEIIAETPPAQKSGLEFDDLTTSLLQRPFRRILQAPTKSEVDEIIERENRNSSYTSLKDLIELTKSDSFGAPRPPLKDSIVEKAVEVDGVLVNIRKLEHLHCEYIAEVEDVLRLDGLFTAWISVPIRPVDMDGVYRRKLKAYCLA